MFRSREFAEITGVTVRTLHHYDRIGLLKPRQRTPAGYRLYERRDIERLEQIIALRYLGLPLRDIGQLLARRPAEVANTLRIQRQLLEEKRSMLDRAIRAIEDAERMTSSADKTEWLKKIIEVIEMESANDWTEKYLTAAGRAKIEVGKRRWTPELQERVSRQWNELITDVERALGEDPTGERAQNLATRWNALVEEFTGRDKDVVASVAIMWANRENWPAHMNGKAPVIRREVWDFIARANAFLGYTPHS